MSQHDLPPAPAQGFIAWRHPRPLGNEGLCIGRTDLGVDPRRVRRLARRIHRHALRHGLPRLVCTSPLKRCHAVGRHLRRLGWRHVLDAALLEADFGTWEGRAWIDIGQGEIDAWVSDFLHHRPGGGESLQQVLARAALWRAPQPGVSVVGHAGWMLARRWLDVHGAHQPPRHGSQWPAAPAHGQPWCLNMVV